MRKPTLLALALMALGFTVVGIHSGRGIARNMAVRHEVKDLPEHGLTIITPSDPRFDEEMSAFLGGADGGLGRDLEAVRPFCAFLRNTSAEEVVAYKLKWELMGSDGQVMTRYTSTLNPAKLMGEEVPGGVETGREVRPNASRFIAWEASLTSLLHARRDDQGGPPTPATQKRAAILTALADAIGREMAPVVGVTVSIDGAFFADGTFVGPDADHTFAEVQGYVEAKLDLALLVESGKRQGRSPAEIIEQLSAGLGGADVTADARPAPPDFKTYFMNSHVQDLLRMREARGDDFALEQTALALRRERVRLRKKSK